MGAKQLENTSVEKEPGVLVNVKVNMSQQCDLATKKSNVILRCIRKTVISKLREVIFSFYSVMVSPHLEY